MATGIYRTNSSFVKKPYIEKAREKIKTIRIFFRLVRDLKQIELKKIVDINDKVENASKQASPLDNFKTKAIRLAPSFKATLYENIYFQDKSVEKTFQGWEYKKIDQIGQIEKVSSIELFRIGYE